MTNMMSSAICGLYTDIIDIEVNGIQRNAILEFRISDYKTICNIFAEFILVDDQNNGVLIGTYRSINYEIAIEHSNINTLVNINALKQWFYDTIVNLSEIQNVMSILMIH